MFGSTFDLLPVGDGGEMEAVLADLKKNFAADAQAAAPAPVSAPAEY